MTVITGETGAGKTLIVDALDLLCGGRADASLVRDGADEARVEGRFVDGDDEVVLARVIPAVGRTRGYIDGRLATAAELTERGRALVDLHGSTRTSRCWCRPSSARCSIGTPVSRRSRPTPSSPKRARRAGGSRNEQAEIGGDDRSRARQLDLLRYELAEIEAAEIEDADEEAALATEEEILADAEAHRDALEDAHTQLDGAAQDAFGAAIASVAPREPFATIADRLRALQIETAEVAHDVRVAAEQIVADPQRLADVQQRRARLRELVRKYGPTLADVQAYAVDARERIAQMEGHDARAAALEAALADATRRVADGGPLALDGPKRRGRVRSRRRWRGTSASSRCRPPRFEVAIEPGDPETAGEDGSDEVTFLLAPNPGESARPLAKAASGGELARAMLALRVVLSAAPPTLVFDEVDAGIGGEAGTAVGRALATLGGQHQVLCVTHLPQVAAFADAQVAVSKGEVGRRTVANAELVLDDARVGEVSRMLAGVGESAHARQHAEELLANAARVPQARPGEGRQSGGPHVKLRRRRGAASGRGSRPRARRSPDQGSHPPAQRGRHRDHRPPRHRPGRGRHARGRRRRRGREREPVDLRPLPERRSDPDRRGRHPAARRGRPRRHGPGPRRRGARAPRRRAVARPARSWRSARCWSPTRSTTRMEEARRTIGTELQSFAKNTLAYIETEAADHVRAARSCRRCGRRSKAGTRSLSCAATTTSTTSKRCARTSASTSRC